MFEFDQKAKKKDKEDVFHFISYIPFAGRLIELDGLKEGPYDLGPIADGQDWVAVAKPHIEKRMQKYATGEIHFNLMALVSDQKMIYTQRIQELETKNTEEASAEIVHLRMMISEEEAKMARYKAENIRRKHNYLPLIIEILKQLGEQGKLVESYDKAKQKAIQQSKSNKDKS